MPLFPKDAPDAPGVLPHGRSPARAPNAHHARQTRTEEVAHWRSSPTSERDREASESSAVPVILCGSEKPTAKAPDVCDRPPVRLHGFPTVLEGACLSPKPSRDAFHKGKRSIDPDRSCQGLENRRLVDEALRMRCIRPVQCFATPQKDRRGRSQMDQFPD